MIRRVYFIKVAFVLILGQISSCIHSQTLENVPPQIPSHEILTSTFRIKSTQIGTCYAIDINKVEYIVTAKHLLARPTNGQLNIEIEFDGKFEKFNGKVYFHPNADVDVALIKLNETIGAQVKYEIDGRSILGQDCYFIGFPLGGLGTRMKGGKIGLVKKAIISSIQTDWLGVDIYLLDGYNIPGFSGGPVIYYDFESKKNKILGTITAYYDQPMERKLEINKQMFDAKTLENSGVVLCYPSSFLNDIIKANSLR